MKLIVGLGNPGAQYARTRHNIGFMVVDELARSLDASWKLEAKFKAEVALVDLPSGERLILAKPQTFMNLSGQSIRKISDFYKISSSDTWVLFDDVDTPFGRLRIRQGGSGSGHQGVNSTLQHLGPDFWRFKIGVSLNDRTKEPSEVYVLKPFNPGEQAQIPALIVAAVEVTTRQLTEPTPQATTYELL
jgi:PTH1 family peptidyl-tRNA hydrolase